MNDFPPLTPQDELDAERRAEDLGFREPDPSDMSSHAVSRTIAWVLIAASVFVSLWLVWLVFTVFAVMMQ